MASALRAFSRVKHCHIEQDNDIAKLQLSRRLGQVRQPADQVIDGVFPRHILVGKVIANHPAILSCGKVRTACSFGTRCVISTLKRKHNRIEPAVDYCDILTSLVCPQNIIVRFERCFGLF
jgi:hypothetical protein